MIQNAKVVMGYRQRDPEGINGTCQGTRFLAYPETRVVWKFRRGTVKEVGYSESRGHYVMVRKGWREHAFYHLTHVYVVAGQRLTAGTCLGRAGLIGRTNYPQLYYVVRTYPYGAMDTCNPRRYIK